MNLNEAKAGALRSRFHASIWTDIGLPSSVIRLSVACDHGLDTGSSNQALQHQGPQHQGVSRTTL